MKDRAAPAPADPRMGHVLVAHPVVDDHDPRRLRLVALTLATPEVRDLRADGRRERTQPRPRALLNAFEQDGGRRPHPRARLATDLVGALRESRHAHLGVEGPFVRAWRPPSPHGRRPAGRATAPDDPAPPTEVVRGAGNEDA